MTTDTAGKLDELLDGLAEYLSENKDQARTAALKLHDKEGTRAIADVLLKKGRTARTADATNKATELEEDNKKLADELAEAKQQIRELEAKEPNWDRRLKDEAAKWQKRVDEAEAKVSQERDQGLNDMVSIARQRFQNALRLGQEGGVDEHYGALLPSHYADRFVKDPDSRTVKVLEIGEKDSYYDPAEGDPAEQLARDALSRVPPKERIAGMAEGGGGTGNGSGPVNKAVQQIVDTKARTGAYQL